MKTWKVILADDEALIRSGIRSSIPWEQLQMDVVGEAEDGEEALELALQLKADLMLVDLNMPIMDGLTLIGELREKLPECRVIIVTGHEEFSYAQKAIRLGVDDYVLKPIRVNQLTHVLSEAKNQLDQQSMQQKHFELANRQIAKNLLLLRERFCLEWIDGELNTDQIREQLKFLQLPSNAPRLLGVVRWPEVSRGQQFLRENDRQLFLFAIENIIGEYMIHSPHVLFRDRGGLIIVLTWDMIAEETLAQMEQSISKYLKISTKLHFTNVAGGLSGVPAGYLEARQSVYQEIQLSPLVRRAKLFVQEHYAEPELTLEEVAESLQVSPVYFGRVFKQEVGVSLGQYLAQMRMKRAIQLLVSTELNILEIAERVGYHSQHYFSTSFRKAIGISPLQYRRGGLSDDVEVE
ncbi:response regulator [Paenibacillus aestuarii]|uniref:Response regulator n=1 Tax=Paenibacillus aestuarii TaxID=516965 RepID=A0ABW0K1K7_9BACL|nr:response regulator [Paenibacillus aestuarii]